ncbi:BTB/POZ domain-containing protein 2 [Myotis davidii]|uniref:BTB/POZ domain-containing protein 2 n=1 Tax=Myotis davidii TaxID=225400 RepID=L5LSP9_MYODS|nr:BTB/POZ domain-containing protein 2 [Myotis davidii]
MFNGGMATTSTEIELPDVEPAAFLALLKIGTITVGVRGSLVRGFVPSALLTLGWATLREAILGAMGY